MTPSNTRPNLPALAKYRGRHYLDDQDYSAEELLELIDLAVRLKALWRTRPFTPFLLGKSLAMIFDQGSMRTRVSFETGMYELGGHALYLRPGEIHLPGKESVGDTARALSVFNNAIEMRYCDPRVLTEFAAGAEVPVINGMVLTVRDPQTGKILVHGSHPAQSMTDAMTVMEKRGRIEGLTIAWVGVAEDVGWSDVLTFSRLGANVRVAAPKHSPLTDDVCRKVRANCDKWGTSLHVTDDPVDAVTTADVVFTQMWWWDEDDAEKERYMTLSQPFQVNEDLMRHAAPDAMFMHCLPAQRGQEVTDAVIDSPASVVWDEAENRKHFQKGLLLALIGIDDLPADPDLHEIGRALLS